MAHGRHLAKKPKRRLWPAWLLIAVVVLAASFGGVAAYLSTSAGPVDNSFSVDTEKNPDISDAYKVSNTNTGYSVYVRAVLVVNWKDSDGNVLSEYPKAGEDYAIVMNTAQWTEHGGFWYYNSDVAPGAYTEPLITSLTAISEQSGYTLTAEIAAQTIQALGSTDVDGAPYTDGIPAVEDTWGVSIPISNGG